MNIQQLQYIVAVDEHRHFQKAADACFITPATLSMMIKKLELELDVVIFDRSKQPVVPTDLGIAIIEHAKTVLYHVKNLENTAKKGNEEIAGEVRLAIIPTLAPYLTHLFLPKLLNKYPKLSIKLFEWNTNQIIEALNHDRLDIGIAATPVNRPEIKELPIFYEKLLLYSAQVPTRPNNRMIAPKDIDLKKLWLLDEDHCLRAQVANLCSLKKKKNYSEQLDFEAGSIESLLNIVHMNQGITIIPELTRFQLSKERQKGIRQFVAPIPVREISLLSYRHFVKEKLMNAIAEEIKLAVSPLLIKSKAELKIVDI